MLQTLSAQVLLSSLNLLYNIVINTALREGGISNQRLYRQRECSESEYRFSGILYSHQLISISSLPGKANKSCGGLMGKRK